MTPTGLPLILASTSPYRKELLQKLGLPFQSMAPNCDEDAYKSQISDPKTLAVTLAEVKAHSLSTAQNCVIGGDQLVSLEGEILCKPKSFEGACLQLAKMQGKTHQLITALCVIHGGQKIPLLDITEIEMRELSPQQIRAYVTMDQPLDCAGSYKIEKSGLVLVKSLNTKDFSAIQGLPLIQLVQTLTSLGYPIPGSGNKE